MPPQMGTRSWLRGLPLRASSLWWPLCRIISCWTFCTCPDIGQIAFASFFFEPILFISFLSVLRMIHSSVARIILVPVVNFVRIYSRVFYVLKWVVEIRHFASDIGQIAFASSVLFYLSFLSLSGTSFLSFSLYSVFFLFSLFLHFFRT
jgi:hypothetical protein